MTKNSGGTPSVRVMIQKVFFKLKKTLRVVTEMQEEGSIKIWPFVSCSFTYLSTHTFLHAHLPCISF